MNNLTNIGVQLMPVVLLICFGYCLAIDQKLYAGFCFVLALFMWLILWSDQKNLKL